MTRYILPIHSEVLVVFKVDVFESAAYPVIHAITERNFIFENKQSAPWFWYEDEFVRIIPARKTDLLQI